MVDLRRAFERASERSPRLSVGCRPPNERRVEGGAADKVREGGGAYSAPDRRSLPHLPLSLSLAVDRHANRPTDRPTAKSLARCGRFQIHVTVADTPNDRQPARDTFVRSRPARSVGRPSTQLGVQVIEGAARRRGSWP